MAERDRDRDRPHPHQVQVHPQHRYEHLGAGAKSLLPRRGPSASQVVAVVTLLPVAGTLLALAGLTLAGSLIGLLVTTPLFIIFSPVIVPAAIAIGLAMTGFFTSGAFGLTGLTSFSWILNSFRQSSGSVPEMADQAKRRMADMAGYVGQKTKEGGQEIQSKPPEVGKTGTVRT
ncbi:oleosin H1-like [Mangifera indica]|uniref:oleosin H1-like n=1 Tax=Mangifera indica TaxID=29780 RepID=UPI001CF979A5|nr:oleosin H1-like [Mangifera indica]